MFTGKKGLVWLMENFLAKFSKGWLETVGVSIGEGGVLTLGGG